MQICVKCKKEIPEGALFCPWCGKKQVTTKRSTSKRANGQGTVYKRGKTWTAMLVTGYDLIELSDGSSKKVARKITKGGFLKKTEAETYAAQMSDSALVPKCTETLKQIYDRWIPYYEPRIDKQTLSTYKAAFKYFKPVWDRPIVELTTAELQDCIDKCGKGRSTLNNMRSVISHLFKYAEANKVPLKNLAPFLYVASVKKGTRRAFTDDELEKIKNAVGVFPYADYVFALIYLGWRPNELLSMPKTRYDEKGKYLIGGFKTPAGTDRIVTISPKIQGIIDAQMQTPGEWLFPNKTTWAMMNDEEFLTDCFKPLMDHLGIEDTTTYSCRHTFANLIKKVQGSDTDKAALMGHANPNMTKYYQSADYGSLKAITDKIYYFYCQHIANKMPIFPDISTLKFGSGPKGRVFKSRHLDHGSS